MTYQRAMEGRPSPCRFTPSCSSYALEALQVHGSRRGLWLTVRRLLRCRPFGPSGWDPVPSSRSPGPPAAQPGRPSFHPFVVTSSHDLPSHDLPSHTPSHEKALFA